MPEVRLPHGTMPAVDQPFLSPGQEDLSAAPIRFPEADYMLLRRSSRPAPTPLQPFKGERGIAKSSGSKAAVPTEVAEAKGSRTAGME